MPRPALRALLAALLVFVAVLGVGGALAPPGAASPGPPGSAPRHAPPPGLVFLETEHDAGRLDAGAAFRAEFPWRREGPGDLVGFRVETGCGCAVATGLPPSIPAGAEGVLAVDVAGRSNPGPFFLVVRVRSERAGSEGVALRVRGFVGSLVVVEPRAMDVGRLLVGSEAVRSVVVRTPPGRDNVRVLAAVHRLEGTCDVRGPARLGARGADVSVRLRAPPTAGPFHGHVELVVEGEGTWRVPIRGEAVPAVGPAPSSPAGQAAR